MSNFSQGTSTVDSMIASARASLARNQVAEALRLLKQAHQLSPTHPVCLFQLAQVCLRRGNAEEALHYGNLALQQQPDTAVLHSVVGSALRMLGRHEEAIASFDTALTTEPDLTPAVAGKAEALERLGRSDEALTLLTSAVEAGRASTAIVLALARNCKRIGKPEQSISPLTDAIARAQSDSEKSALCFQLGATLEALQQYDNAVDAYENANAAQPRPTPSPSIANEINALINTFSPRFWSSAPRSTGTTDRPIFIVGMPRSGTSLVEQILDCHPHVFGAGELEEMGTIAAQIPRVIGSSDPFPMCMKSITQPHLDQLAQAYLDRLNMRNADAAHVTDKMPANFKRLGLIAMLFPNARIIHCTRDPLDTCFSCFASPLPAEHWWSTSLSDTAEMYVHYQRLMAHWSECLPIPIHDVQYEELVADQEAVSRAMIDFCGLEWDNACLRFHESKRVVRTLSTDQVRQPVYDSSIGRASRFGDRVVSVLREGLGAK
ncbi:MAG: tetratricopeptide repeat protein [Planctomycetes bacterium]|nr:tetratricopeptide repeat protein [Planctomycetota bacterium]